MEREGALSAKDFYEKRKVERAETAAALNARANAISTMRVVTFLGAIVGVGVLVWAPVPSFAWVVPVGLVVAFFALVVLHARIHDERERALAAVTYFEEGLARLAGEWKAGRGGGERFLATADAHPYVDDLDVFGKGSLFHLLDRTATKKGEEMLAGWLKGDLDDEAPARTLERQDAVRELAALHDLREKLSVSGAMLGDDKPDPTPFAIWAGNATDGPPSAGLRVVAFIVPAITLTLLALGQAKVLPWWAFLPSLAVGLAVTRSFRARVDRALSVAASKESALGRYGEMLERIEASTFTSKALGALHERLKTAGGSATLEMARLGRIVAFVDARENEFFRLFVSPVLLWDVHCAASLEGWRARAGKSAAKWFSALSEMEGYASLATFAFENPTFVYPSVSDGASFVAKNLGHPLLAPGKRVGNDVTFEGAGSALVVTGSNMSGKSTLLRALGTNAVLARTGAPVSADSLAIGRFRVATSMRVRDSLDEGVSRFYAELRKLKVVLDRARENGKDAAGGKTTFFLLDEILHGTNTRERLIGARAIVRELVSCGAVGAVSTHDLALGDLETELPTNVRNVHFEEQVEGDIMSFDYKLRSGVVQSSNALRLMHIVGLDVTVPADETSPAA